MTQSLSRYYGITTTALFILAIVIMFIIKRNVNRNSCVRKMQLSFAELKLNARRIHYKTYIFHQHSAGVHATTEYSIKTALCIAAWYN